MIKPLIAVDMDDVLADENGAMLAFSNERFNAQHTLEDFSVRGDYWGYWEMVLGLTDDEGKEHFGEFIKSPHESQQRLIPGAVEAIEALKRKYRLVIVTARPNILIDQTHEWLEKHFPRTFDGVEFLALWKENEPNATKALICNQLGADILIDDNLEHCRLAAEAGVTALLFGNYGWNQTDELPTGVDRIENWEAIRERLGTA